ncbi:hypothetical protein FSW04_17600 [Baekduia soli]|uniref:Uncharacterized protein n=1 Tax=Baekduia soli TaxID=496014 RepID=A0A5B8U7X0_9ACTN|nr:hypothetical protein [Baekduia soli]QEC49213.1 hypothetical protein FSW04_17600 [Baekduia soli]
MHRQHIELLEARQILAEHAVRPHLHTVLTITEARMVIDGERPERIGRVLSRLREARAADGRIDASGSLRALERSRKYEDVGGL